MPGQSSMKVRFCLSHFPHRRTSSKRTGPLSAGYFLFSPNARPHDSVVGARCSDRSGNWALLLADSGSANSLALAALRNFLLPTILAWECWPPSPTLASRGKLRRGRGCRKTETTSAAARLSAAAELDRPAYRFRPRIRWTLSTASGNPAFVLCQCPQESLLLSRLRPGRRSHSLCPVVPSSVLSPKCRLPRAAKRSSH